jgi:RNA-binding protein
MELKGKSKRYLRSLGQGMNPTLMLGREGFTPGLRAALADELARRELVKVRVQKGAGGETSEWAQTVAAETDATVVGVVGYTFLLYRPNPELKERIQLPQD